MVRGTASPELFVLVPGGLVYVIPRLRLLLARRPWLYWSFVALCAIVVWSGVRSATAAALAQQHHWGESRPVLVVAAAIPAGQPIRASPRQYPLAMVPPSAVTSLPSPATAAQDLAPGEIVVATDVVGPHSLPRGWVVFGVPGTDRPTLVVGDHVALFGEGTRWCDGQVTGVAERAVDVAVPSTCADSVSARVAAGSVVLARA